ncbi:MAG: hypothetical protein ACYCZY_12490 [Lacisediminihabitans sp.]
MDISRRAGLPLVAIAALLGLAACAGSSGTPTPSPTPEPVDTTTYIGQAINPVDTTWTGTDSAGDFSSFTLHKDHTVAVAYAKNSFDAPGDSWSVQGGVLELHIFINQSDGTLNYRGQYDPATKTIAATATATISAKKLTVTLTDKK